MLLKILCGVCNVCTCGWPARSDHELGTCCFMQHACTRPCVLRISRWTNMSCAGMCDAARRGDIMEQCSLHPLLEWGLASFLWLDSYNDDDGGEGMVTSCWVPLWHVPLGCLCACGWCVPAVGWVAAVVEVAVACGAVKCNGQAGVIAQKLQCTRYCYAAGRGSAGTVSVHTGSRNRVWRSSCTYSWDRASCLPLCVSVPRGRGWARWCKWLAQCGIGSGVL